LKAIYREREWQSAQWCPAEFKAAAFAWDDEKTQQVLAKDLLYDEEDPE
jgi:hypothetical protein